MIRTQVYPLDLLYFSKCIIWKNLYMWKLCWHPMHQTRQSIHRSWMDGIFDDRRVDKVMVLCISIWIDCSYLPDNRAQFCIFSYGQSTANESSMFVGVGEALVAIIILESITVCIFRILVSWIKILFFIGTIIISCELSMSNCDHRFQN